MPGLDMPAIPMPIQKESSGKRYIPYGADNRYPDYLLSLYSDCSTLKAIIDGNVNYVMGDELQIAPDSPMEPIKLTETVREIVRDWYIFGYAFVQVLRNPYGQIVDIIRLPGEYVRTDKEHQAFWYCENWKKGEAVVYPVFSPDFREDSSVLMIGKGRGTYPAPLWSAAVKDAEMERRVEEFHLNELKNNFLSSAIINFNNGKPSNAEKEILEREIEEKFGGTENAGRIMLSFNENVTNRTTIDRLASDNFDTRYQALAQRTREQIFVAFKAQPILFGLTSETNTGFSTTEFGDLFKLYSKTMILPVQQMMSMAFGYITGNPDFLNFTPFTI
jgi:hypothetical protein